MFPGIADRLESELKAGSPAPTASCTASALSALFDDLWWLLSLLSICRLWLHRKSASR